MDNLSLSTDSDNIVTFNRLYKKQKALLAQKRRTCNKEIKILVTYQNPLDPLEITTRELTGIAFHITPLLLLEKLKEQDPAFGTHLSTTGLITHVFVDNKFHSLFMPLDSDCNISISILRFETTMNYISDNVQLSSHIDHINLKSYTYLVCDFLEVFFNCYNLKKDENHNSMQMENILLSELGYREKQDADSEKQYEDIIEDVIHNLELFYKLNKYSSIECLEISLDEISEFRLHTVDGKIKDEIKTDVRYNRKYYVYKIGKLLVLTNYQFVTSLDYLQHFVKTREFMSVVNWDRSEPCKYDIFSLLRGIKCLPTLEMKNNYLKNIDHAEEYEHTAIGRRLKTYGLPRPFPDNCDPAVDQSISVDINLMSIHTVTKMFYDALKFEYIKHEDVDPLPASMWKKTGLHKILPFNQYAQYLIRDRTHGVLHSLSGHRRCCLHHIYHHADKDGTCKEDAPYRYYSVDQFYNENSDYEYGYIYRPVYIKDNFHIIVPSSEQLAVLDELLRYMKTYLDMLNLKYVLEVRHSPYMFGKKVDEEYLQNMITLTHQFCKEDCKMSTTDTFKMLYNEINRDLNKCIKNIGFENIRASKYNGRDYGIRVCFRVKDIRGREVTLSAFDIDICTCYYMALFLFYKGSNKAFERTYLIHGSFTNSLQRISGILQEHYMGELPFFLSKYKIVFIQRIGERINRELVDLVFNEELYKLDLEDFLVREYTLEKDKKEICKENDIYKMVVFLKEPNLKVGEKFEIWIKGEKIKSVSWADFEEILRKSMDISDYKLHDDAQF